ncbi:DUF397 domain-containing protein [Nocardia bovistercoris]|uniref:DUF397 domain-containing protein n=1 Tax=Nocardia bovistercoris TaxID=2785916 RepID=A0A931IJI8_9NOCA|nr:DUF397 domain-containing protein [Nocardia bovistercoris]MBH0781142.1 DUF397 domain-containing protein [Nocardia bovistercoris]
MQQLPEFALGEFKKASASSPSQNCVTVARVDGYTAIRDDKLPDPAGRVPHEQLIILTDDQFDHFQHAVRAGRTVTDHLSLLRRADGMYAMRATTVQLVPDVELLFDHGEIDAFRRGILAHEFALGAALAA